MKSLHLATVEDLPKLLPMVAGFHSEMGYGTTPEHQSDAVMPLLEGSPHGAIWLIGPKSSPLGYVMVTFGWSMPHGGMVGWLEECYIRPSVRGRGIGTEVLHAVAVNLGRAGMQAMHAILPAADPDAAARFCAKAGFRAVPGVRMMTDPL